jgi:organic radical activating enzyme
MSFWSDYDFRKIPFEKIARVGQRSLIYRDLFAVSWLLGRFCNYKCSYCWPYARSDQKDHRPTEVVISTLDEIKRQARERGFNSFHFSFSGGEPTLHPGYLEILKHYSDDLPNVNYQSVHMTSNLSLGMNWFKKYVEVTKNLHRVSITASYHKEFAVKEKFADKLVFLQENDVHVTINSVMVPQKFEAIWEDMLYFHERGINVTLKPQSNPTATKVVDGYTDEMLDKLRNGMPQRNYTQARMRVQGQESKRPMPQYAKLPKDAATDETLPPHFQVEMNEADGTPWYMDQAERFNAFDFNQFKGWECSSGYRSIIIREPDGFIKRSYSCNDKPLGHIETGFQLFDGPALCQTPNCVSSADSKIPKRKPGVSLPLWPGDETFKKTCTATPTSEPSI